VLKQLVRNVIQPDKDLGHSDSKPYKSKSESTEESSQQNSAAGEQEAGNKNEAKQSAADCDDCK
jgi:hypothetical protein